MFLSHSYNDEYLKPAVGKSVGEKLDNVCETLIHLNATNKKLLERLEKNEGKFVETRALMYIKEIIKLIKAALNRIHTRAQFDRLCIASYTKEKKSCTEPFLKKKYEEFKDFKNQLDVIENKIRPIRNKKGHPLDSLNEISLDEINEDLRVLSNLKDLSISKLDIEIINIMARYAGVKTIEKRKGTMFKDFNFYHTCSNY